MMLVHCWDCWRFADMYEGFPITHTLRRFPHFLNVGYSADNSCRAISTRSLNVRSRII